LITDGERFEGEDCIVAATAVLNDEPVVTRNVDHYARVDGLDVRTY
jgi:predicted nucleic acid-binding protein